MRKECESVFLFIAELTGSFVAGTGTVEDKIKCGQQDYVTNHLPKLDLEDEGDRADMHEVVWLERLYAELDDYFRLPAPSQATRMLSLELEQYRDETYKWSVPIEIDASASMLQYIGIFCNDRRLMEMTNVIGETLEDPWKMEGMPRKMLKVAATPMLYGSSKAAHELWQDAGIKYTNDDIKLYAEQMASGPFGVANAFKEFLIGNCQPKVTMKLDIWNDSFEVSCNRYRNVGEKTKAYKIWDSVDERYNTVLHTDTKQVPDLKQFKRFFVTALVHNLDSQVMNNVMTKVMDKYGWGIPIHDAAVVSPAAAEDTRKWYAEELDKIHANRDEILSKYFKSIGISSAAQQEWENLKARVVPFEGTLKTSLMALK